MTDAIYWASADVLILAAQLAQTPDLPPAQDLRQRVTDLLDRMVGAARTGGVAEPDIAEARYALVAFIDEQILKSSWYGKAEWMQHPLQLAFYRENTAGENFFARMRALLNQGGRLPALQIYYLCLALGFRGAYGQTGNAEALTSFSQAAQAQLVQQLPPATKMSPHAQPRDRASAERTSKTPLIILLAVCSLIAVAVVITLSLLLRSATSEAVDGIAVKAAPSAAPPALPTPRPSR